MSNVDVETMGTKERVRVRYHCNQARGDRLIDTRNDYIRVCDSIEKKDSDSYNKTCTSVSEFFLPLLV